MAMKHSKKKEPRASSGSVQRKDPVFQIINLLLTLLAAFACFYPFYYLFLVSISDANAVARGEVLFWPVKTTLTYYKQVLEIPGIVHAFGVSVARTVLGTAITVFFTTMLAYVMTKKEFKWHKFCYRMVVFTMYVGAGLIPWVVTMTVLGLRDTFWLYILPSAVYAYGMVLIKTYIEQLPPEIEESAVIDGAGYFTILTRIIVPISKPSIAVVAIYSAVGQWNSFQDTFFLVRDKALNTMQFLLYNFLQQAESMARQVQTNPAFALQQLTPPSPFTLKCAVAVVTLIPVLLIYPLLQKHFAKGIMLGAVKG